MADIQTQFVQFDDKIRLTWNNEEKTLRGKRDIILDKLRDRFDALRRQGQKIPSFKEFNQGSYKMSTGIHPVDGDYDIDVGLKFNCAPSAYPNPVDLKALVADALEDHTRIGTTIHLSCVRVGYMVDGKQEYHVDLAIYTGENLDTPTEQLFLAKGERGAAKDKRWWEESDPQGLIQKVDGRFSDPDDEQQFLRVIRILKRWKTRKFQQEGQNKPSGIGLTVAGLAHFKPHIQRDAFSGKSPRPDDLAAMKAFVSTLLRLFQPSVTQDGKQTYTLSVPLPVRPWKNIFEQMSAGQMTTFHRLLGQLQQLVEEVTNEPDPIEACKRMRSDFDDEFPVPEKSSTGQRGGRIRSA